MSYKFQPAVREDIGLWVNMVGGTGSGKTFSALRLASGIAGDKPFAFIDTENRRGLHYADQFNFHYAEITSPFRPDCFSEAVMAADAANYPVIVIDSGSLVWSGDGGVLDWQEAELKRLGGGENVKMLSWVKPKTSHKRMVTKFLQVKAHIILCLRAEEKIEMVKVGNKTEVRPKASLTGLNGWLPICDKTLPFEATCSFLLMADEPGKPHPIKLQEQHKPIFPAGQLIDEEAGRRLAEWAKGGQKKPSIDLVARRSAMVDHFGAMGVTTAQILTKVGKPSLEEVGEEEIVTLKAIATDIKSKDQTIESAFPAHDEATDTETVAEPVDELENLRANAAAALDALSATRRKDLIAGKPLVKNMTAEELTALLAAAGEA